MRCTFDGSAGSEALDWTSSWPDAAIEPSFESPDGIAGPTPAVADQIANNFNAWWSRDDVSLGEALRLNWRAFASPPESTREESRADPASAGDVLLNAVASVARGAANFATGGYLARRDQRSEAYNEGTLSIYEYEQARTTDTLATGLGMLAGSGAALAFGARNAMPALAGHWQHAKLLASTAGLYWGVASSPPTMTQLAVPEQLGGEQFDHENANFSMVQALPFAGAVAVGTLTLQNRDLSAGFLGVGVGNSPGPTLRVPTRTQWEDPGVEGADEFETGLGIRYSVATPIVGPLRTSELSGIVTGADAIRFLLDLAQGELPGLDQPLLEPTVQYKLSEKRYSKVGGDPSYSIAIGIYRRPKSP